MLLVKIVAVWPLPSHGNVAFEFLREVEKPLGRVLGIGEFRDTWGTDTLVHFIDLVLAGDAAKLDALLPRYQRLQSYLAEAGASDALIDIKRVNGIGLSYSFEHGRVKR